MYILFEGIDTSGKTTQIELLKEAMPQIITTREPGGTPFGDKIRDIVLNEGVSSSRAEILLFLADRAEHYAEVILPIRDFEIVVSDRGYISGIAYAMALGEKDMELLLQMNRFAMDDRLPDAVILFSLDEQSYKQRMAEKSSDLIESRGIEYMMRVQHYMIEVAKKSDIELLIIDATDTIENIHHRVMNYIKELNRKLDKDN